jgi:hypothetical protein
MEIKPEKKRNRFFLELFRVTVKVGGDESCQYCTGADITLASRYLDFSTKNTKFNVILNLVY